MQHRDSATWITGIDVSGTYQPNTDWDAVVADPQPLDFVYIRIYGSNHTSIDTDAVRNASELKRLGIPSGGYYYTVPKLNNGAFDLQDARNQAQQFIDGLQTAYGAGKFGELVPMMDFEDSTNQGDWELLTVNQRIEWHLEFRNYFEANCPRKLGIYSSPYVSETYLNNFNEGTTGNPFKDMILWTAYYETYAGQDDGSHPDFGGWTEWTIWQYTWNGNYNGIDSLNTPAQRADATDMNRAVPLEYFAIPKKVEGLNATDNGTEIHISWTSNTEADIAGYHIYLNGAWHGYNDGKANTSYIISGLSTGTNYTLGVRAIDQYGDLSEETTEIVYLFGTPSEPIITTETLKPLSILLTNMTPNDITFIQDDPNAPDANNIISVDQTIEARLNINFEPIAGDELTGIQTLRVNFNDSWWVGLDAILYENDVLVQNLGVSAGTRIKDFTFDAGLLTDKTGAGIQIHFIGTAYFDGIASYKTIDSINAVSLIANVQTEPVQTNVAPTISNISPANNVISTDLNVSANVSDFNGDQVKLIVEYSFSNFATDTSTVESAFVNSGSLATVTLDDINAIQGQNTVSLRLWANDGKTDSQIITSSFVYNTDPLAPTIVTEILKPLTIINTNMTPNNVAFIQDDPDAPDANNIISVDQTISATMDVNFEPIAGDELTGTQEIKINFNDSYWVGLNVDLYENDTLIADLGVSAGTRIKSFTFDANLLSDKTGANVIVKMIGTAYFDGVSTYKTIDSINAISWIANVKTTPIPTNNAPSPVTNITPINGSTTNSLVVSANVSDIDGDNVKLVVEYGKTADFSGEYRITNSPMVASGSVASATLNDTFILEGNTVYMRLYANDGTTDSQIINSSFTYSTQIIEPPPDPDPLPIPKVTIIDVSKPTISDRTGMDRTEITFTFDTDVSEFTVNVNGISADTGIVAHKGGGKTIVQLVDLTVSQLAEQTVQQITFISAGTQIVAEVDYTELYQEGVNRVNLYGKNLEGVWTPYNSN